MSPPQTVLAGIAVLAVAMACSSSSPASVSSPVSSPSPTANTLIELDQTGDYMSGPFTATAEWGIAWSYDCTKITTDHNWLIVAIYRDAGSGTAPFFDTLTPPPAASGTANGSKPETEAGTFYIKFVSECAWHITAVG